MYILQMHKLNGISKIVPIERVTSLPPSAVVILFCDKMSV